MGMRLKQPLGPKDQKEHSGRGKGVVSLLPFPWLAQHHTERALMGLWFLQWGKKKPRRMFSSLSIVGQFLRVPSRVLPDRDHCGVRRA